MSCTLIHGDALAVLRTLPDGSVDAVVTDPPYELGFMGKGWDASGVAFRVDLWTEVLRVAKPGAHLAAFGGTRTYHRMAVAIEDAGWEVRDSLHWLQSQGFPKSLNLGGGLGTALKPAHEPILLARKPFRGTVAACVAEHGTGALNVDACRVAAPDGVPLFGLGQRRSVTAFGDGLGCDGRTGETSTAGRWPPNVVFSHAPGCEPAGTRKVRPLEGHRPNPVAVQSDGLIQFTHKPEGYQKTSYTSPDGTETIQAWNCVPGCPVAALDAQAGERTSGANPTRRSSDKFRGVYQDFAGQAECEPARGADSGVASRFFPVFSPDPDAPFLYVPKASRAEREAGCEHLTARQRDESRDPDAPGADNPRNRGGQLRGNGHPCVKPVTLMSWLVRLVCPPGGTVLDCFAGSGTTGIACLRESRGFIGIEREAEYVEIARARLAAEAPLFTEAAS